MSQEGLIDIVGSHPEIPIDFIANVGSAVPIGNTIELLGEVIAAGTIPFQSIGSGNIITYQLQLSQASASSSATRAGIASFDTADFSVDANGYVTFTGSGGSVTITGNSGGVVSPTLGNFNLLADYTNTVIGNPGTSTLTITPTVRGYPVTPFVVGPSTFAGYQTIQAAVNAANAASGGMVWIQPGTYTENLTLYTNIQLSSPSEQSVTIIGTHTPPSSGTLNINRIAFQSATNIFSSAAAGTTAIIMEDCQVIVTNGFTFDLPNWTGSGSVAVFNIGNFGTNDGFFNNTGGCQFYVFAAGTGNGTSHSMTISGPCVLAQDVVMGCPVNLVTGAALSSYGTAYTHTVTLSNNSIAAFSGDTFTTGATPAVTMSSSGAVSISNAVINTSNNPAIAGSGAGTLSLENITFINNTAIANTLTLSTTGGWYPPGNVGTSGFVLTSNGPGVCPTFQAGGGGGTYYSLTPYIVGSDIHSQYSTIQAAINQAITDGAANSNLLNIYIKPGSYTEDLTLSDGICLIGFTPNTYFPDLIQAGVLPPSSVILNGSITSGGSGAATNIISGISQVLTGAGNAINISSTGVLYLKNFTSQINNGTLIVVPAASQAIIVADTSNFISDQMGNAVQLYALGDGSGLTFNGNQVQIYVGPNETTSTTGTGSGAIINFNNSSATYSQVAQTMSSIGISATYSNINGAFAPFLTANVDSSPSSSSVSLNYSQGVGNIFTDNSNSGTLNVFYSNWSGGYTGVPVTNIFQNISSTGEQGLNTSPANSQDSSLSLGSAYLNPFGYDVMLTIYINVTVAAGASILCGVGNTNTPTQQTIYNGLSVTGIIPVSVYLPVGYYALISTSGTITAAITGQQVTPV